MIFLAVLSSPDSSDHLSNQNDVEKSQFNKIDSDEDELEQNSSEKDTLPRRAAIASDSDDSDE